MIDGYDDIMFRQHKAWQTARRFITFKEYKYIAQRWRFDSWQWPPRNWRTAIQRCIKFGKWNHLA